MRDIITPGSEELSNHLNNPNKIRQNIDDNQQTDNGLDSENQEKIRLEQDISLEDARQDFEMSGTKEAVKGSLESIKSQTLGSHDKTLRNSTTSSLKGSTTPRTANISQTASLYPNATAGRSHAVQQVEDDIAKMSSFFNFGWGSRTA